MCGETCMCDVADRIPVVSLSLVVRSSAVCNFDCV